MTAPRFQVHPDGRWAVRYLDGSDWQEYDAAGRWLGPQDPSEDGWAEAVLVAPAKPVVTGRVCGCGKSPDGCPGWGGCTSECMSAEVVNFDNRVDLFLPDRVITNGTGETYAVDGAERAALALLGAALYARGTEAVPS